MTSTATVDLDLLCVNTIRMLSIDGVQQANSGHPGLPLGAAPMAYALWQKHLKHDPADATWPDRDRFVLSAGHGSMLLYSLLHLYGYPLSLDDLKAFRQWGSRTPGHPEAFLTPGVEATTGPLGQGIANAVGMALAERMLAHRFNRPGHAIVDHWTYALAGDGCMMEGIASEAASLAGHLKLGKLVLLYDSNDVSLDGPTSLSFSEDVGRRYEAYGWRVLHVRDGDRDLAALDRALAEARADAARPALIVVKTTIGFGSPKKAGTSEAHGSPLGPDEVAATKQALGWDPNAKFLVPAAAAAQFAGAAACGAAAHRAWSERFAAYERAHPAEAKAFRAALAGELAPDFAAGLPTYEAGTKVATRKAGGAALNALAARVPELAGGDADLSVSTSTSLKGLGDFEAATGSGRNVHFGVREHAMAAIANGMCWHRGIRPFVSTFFVFSDYLKPALRLAALNHLPVVYAFTHDSIALGEDGPTHQPVEHLMALRAVPNVAVIRPADGNETAAAWKCALERKDGPTAIVLSRQDLPVLERTVRSAAVGVPRGGYILAEADGTGPNLVLVATGSDVQVALAARDELQRDGIRTRVVSMPCFLFFDRQEREYRDIVLPKGVPKVAVEAGTTLGWERYVGERERVVGIDRFGASAPGNVVLERLGITAAAVVAAARLALG